MTPLVIEIKRRLVGNRRDDRATLPCGYLYDLIEQVEATAEREARLRGALRSCLSCMEIQEHREDESFHLSAEAFRPMWDEAKARAEAALETKGGKREKPDQSRN